MPFGLHVTLGKAMRRHSDGTLSVWKTNHLLIFAVEEYKSFSEQNWNNSLLPHFWNSYVFLFPLSKRLPSYLGSFPRCLSFSVLLRTSFWELGGSRADPAGELQLSKLLNLLSPAFLVSRAGEIIHNPGSCVRTESWIRLKPPRGCPEDGKW